MTTFLDQGRSDFEASPVRYIHPDRVSEWLPHLPADLAGELVANPRLQPRLSDIIVAHYDLGACSWQSDIDCAIAALSEQQFSRLIEAAGAIWHGRVFARLIGKSAIQNALSIIDERTFRLAVAKFSFAPAADDDQASTCDIPKKEAVESEGKLCLAAWLSVQPVPISKRVALKFSPTFVFGEPTPKHNVYGPAIVRKCGESLFNG